MIRVILNILIFTGSIFCLRWSSSLEKNLLQSPIGLSLTSFNPSIDMYSGDQVIIYKDGPTYNNIFTIYCLVGGYSPTSDMIYRFCKEESCQNEWKETDMFTDVNIFNYKISRAPNPSNKKGLTLKLKFPEGAVDSSGNFHCEAQDKAGNFMVRSNDIQIRDINYWLQNIIMNKDNVKTTFNTNITRDKMPITFKCLENGLTYNPQKPIWFQQLSVSPVEWSICPVKNNYQQLTVKEKQTYSKCVQFTTQIFSGDDIIKPRSPSDITQWITYDDNDGNLQVFDIGIDQTSPSLTYAIMCYIKVSNLAVPINTYIKTDNGDDIVSGVDIYGTPSTYKIPIKALVPTEQKITLYTRKYIPGLTKDRVVSLMALYQAPSTAMFYWKLNGKQLNSGTNIRFNKYSVQFIADITTEMAGNYSLDVTDGPDQLTMRFYVTVLSLPIMIFPECMPMVRHVMEFDSTYFSCSYKNQPKTLALKINSENINLDQSIAVSTVSLKKSYAYLSELNFTIQTDSKPELDMVTITYQAINLRKSQGQVKYQDHTIMFSVKNEFGLSLKSSSIYVVPRLLNLIVSSPESYNCTTSCSSLTSHKFQCQISIDQYANKELNIDYYWTVSGHRLGPNEVNQFAPYFTLNPDTKELTLNPIKTNDTKQDDFVKTALKDNFIECHLDLISLPEITPAFKYFSSNDETLKNQMKARITLDYQPINTAYIYWVVAVILALIIILLMIVLLARYCMRNKGETYQLDKIERQHGYDPEKELQEEMFKPYEREEHDPDVLSDTTGDRKLSISAQSIGSANNEGELDMYDLDPSNFNEDGSIIGKYAANPRGNRAAMT